MEHRPDIDLTFSRWRTTDERGVDTGRVSRPPRKHRFQIEDLLKDNMIGGSSNVICRKQAIDRAGSFDVTLRAAVDLTSGFELLACKMAISTSSMTF